MAFLKFQYKPWNELEIGGRSAISPEEKEPEMTCPNCRKSTLLRALRANLNVCTCGHHFRIHARQRIRMMTDRGSFRELDQDLQTEDPLQFEGYDKKLEAAEASSKEKEAVLTGTASIDSQKTAIFVMEPSFMMGSMGTVVGEKITRLFEYATANRLPVIGYTVSGGARMQEGLMSLM